MTRLNETSASTTWWRMVERLSPTDRVSWAIQSHLTARGISTLRLPRATVVGVRDGASISELVFNGSEAAGTTLAGESMAAHALTVDALLKRKNFPVPLGRDYTRTQIASAKKYASRIGYPVVVRPANSTRANSMRIVASSEEELVRGMTKVQTKTQGRVVLRELKSPRSAWVQKLPDGKVLRMLVVGHRVAGAVEISPDGIIQETVAVDTIRPEFLRAATDALRAIPGLEHGEVELVTPTEAERFRHLDYFVMHIRSAPDFGVYNLADASGLRVLAAYTDYYLRQSGISAAKPRSKRRLRISYAGIVDSGHFIHSLSSALAGYGYSKESFDIEHHDDDWVSLEVEESPENAGLLALQALDGLPQEEYAPKVLTTILE